HIVPHLVSCFFFSSRRRHTRWPRDWSSDVCSSDLSWRDHRGRDEHERRTRTTARSVGAGSTLMLIPPPMVSPGAGSMRDEAGFRSEERRVGKEGRGRGGAG